VPGDACTDLGLAEHGFVNVTCDLVATLAYQWTSHAALCNSTAADWQAIYASAYAARANLSLCSTHLLQDVLAPLQNATNGTAGCNVTSSVSWPSTLYWAHWILEDMMDNDFNDFVGWMRITHGYDTSDNWVALLVEMLPAARGSFFTHSVHLNVSVPFGVSAPGWHVQRFNGTTYAPMGSVTTYAPLAGAPLFANTVPVFANSGTVIGAQSMMPTLAQRFVNTRLGMPRYAAREFVHVRAVPSTVLSRNESLPDTCTSRYRVRGSTVAMSFVTPLYANTTGGEHATVGEVCPNPRSRFVGEPRHRWAVEGVHAHVACPLFDNCTACLCGAGMAGIAPCRDMCCETWSLSTQCTYGALDSYPL